MYSAQLQSLLIQSRVDELRRTYAAAPRGRATRRDTAPLATHLRRMLERFGARAANAGTAPTSPTDSCSTRRVAAALTGRCANGTLKP
jgi:hypothetical protein